MTAASTSPATLEYAPVDKRVLPLGGRLRATFIFGGGLALANLLLAGGRVWDARSITAALGGTLTAAESDAFETFNLVATGIYVIALLGFLVAFFMWLYRAVGNVRAVTGDSRYSPGWSVGFWFVPLANLVVPYLILKDLWQRSLATAGAAAVGASWVVWIASGFAGRVQEGALERAMVAQDWERVRALCHTLAGLLVADALIWAGLLWIAHRITHAQQAG